MTARIAAALAHGLVLACILAYLVGPIVLVFLLSFSGDAYIHFPPDSWGFDQYRTMVDSEIWTAPIVRSLIMALIVAVLATAVGCAAVLAISRSNLRGRAWIAALALGPLIVPGVVYAIGAYQVFADLHLVGTKAAFVLAHCLLALPLVMIIVGSAIARVPKELELAAMSLGAGRFRALLGVTIPILLPAIIASALFAFSLSLNEVVVSNFLADVTFTTLPVAIFASLRVGVDPVVMAIASTLAVLSCVFIGLSSLLRRRVR